MHNARFAYGELALSGPFIAVATTVPDLRSAWVSADSCLWRQELERDMDRLIRKADVLIEALPYIQRFRGEIIVIKFGGSAMEEKSHVQGILEDVTFMECVGMLPIIVHGGGKAISRGLRESGVDSSFLHGLRVTCERSIEIVERVIKEQVNPSIISLLEQMGAQVKTVHGETILTVTKKTMVDGETGAELDWGFVGEPHEVAAESIMSLLRDKIIPVVTPLGMGADGRVHNVNADVTAAAVAKAVGARKLVFLSDVPGLLRDADDNESVLATLKTSEVRGLIANGVIDGGMLPKVNSGMDALHAGVKKIHMIDGRMPHSLLLEIFTDKGVGTEIVSDE